MTCKEAGKLGAKARNKRLGPAERQLIARIAARERWSRAKKGSDLKSSKSTISDEKVEN
jgi:hypothetical protein